MRHPFCTEPVWIITDRGKESLPGCYVERRDLISRDITGDGSRPEARLVAPAHAPVGPGALLELMTGEQLEVRSVTPYRVGGGVSHLELEAISIRR